MPQSPHRLRNDLKCVDWDVKPYTTNHHVSEYKQMSGLKLYLTSELVFVKSNPEVNISYCSLNERSFFINLHTLHVGTEYYTFL